MNIAILGAGVGGVTTAIALVQRGYDVSIFERTPEPAHIGAGLVVWPNASFVLSKLGLLSQVAALAGRPSKMQRVSAQGEDLGYLDIMALDAHMGFHSYSILRRDLQSVLLGELCRLGIDVHYGHSVSSLAAADDGKTHVLFRNGRQLTPDVVIGADGRMRSVARRFVHGDNTPIYQGFINWIGVYERDTDIVNDMAILDVWGNGERFGVVPVAKNKVYWAGAIAHGPVDSTTAPTNKEELASLFMNWPSPIPSIVENSRESQINKIFVHDHNPIETWHRDNVVLIGDAAHASLPTSGQGACQAMEDAWHLASCLQQRPNSLQTAFESFAARRRDKTSAITRAARSFARSLFNTDADFCRQRNERTQSADNTTAVENMAKGWMQGLPIGA